MKTNNRYKIMTEYGWCDFVGLNKILHNNTNTISLNSENVFIASPNHILKNVNDKFVKVKNLKQDDVLKNGEIVTANVESGECFLYDFVNVDNKEHSYIADNIVHHNCLFQGSSYTLVDGVKLSEIPVINPIFEKDNLEIFFKPLLDQSYIIVVDVSRGRHHDYSALSIINISQMPYEIVGIYKDNDISVLEFPHLIYNLAKQYNDAYILIETNDLGESVSNTIWYEYEYDNIYFTSNNKLSVSNGFPGVRTTAHVKSLGCSILKDLIEQDQLILNSHKIIEELGVFVKKGKSYAASDEMINDDLTTTLWLFAWLTAQDIFNEMININSKKILAEKKESYINENMTPYGFYSNAADFYNAPEDNLKLPDRENPYYLTEDQLELINF